MQLDLIVRGGEVISSSGRCRTDIGVNRGVVAVIGNLDNCDADQVYDASGTLVFPGFIDEHVHSREPGFTDKEDFEHSTRAAAASGITTVVEMPNSVPPVMDKAAFQARARLLGQKAFVDFALWGMVLGDLNRSELFGLAEAGVVGFKLFWGYALDKRTLALVYNPATGQDVVPPPDDGAIMEAFRVIAETGRPVAIHAENAAIIARLTDQERRYKARDYASLLRSRPPYTETMTIDAGIRIAHEVGAYLHILHVSSSEGVERVEAARREGIRVTAETCPHYLFLCDKDYGQLGNIMKVFPPVRHEADRERLWKAVVEGSVQVIGSDHAPHTEEEKKLDLWRAPAGSATIQVTVPLLLNAVSQGRLSLEVLVSVLSENPARLLGIYGQKGVIAPGADADMTIVDLSRPYTLRSSDMLSKSRVIPYEGVQVRGMPIATFVRGCKVMEGNQLVNPGKSMGRLIKPLFASTLR